jgi:hypothetical protein
LIFVRHVRADRSDVRPIRWPNEGVIEASAGEQTRIAGDLARGKIGADELMTVEGEAGLW